MQIAEKFRRAVLVPLDERAHHALSIQEVDDSILVWELRIGTQTEFETIWASGILQAINNKAGTLIDDYEETEIPVDLIPVLTSVVHSYAARRARDQPSADFISSLLQGCDIAQRNRMPMYFIL